MRSTGSIRTGLLGRPFQESYFASLCACLPNSLPSRSILKARAESSRGIYTRTYSRESCAEPSISMELSTLQKLIEKSEEHHIEYRGFLSNHMIHALVALHQLGAPSERLNEYYEFYSKEMEPAIPSEGKITSSNWRALRGQKKLFLDYVEFFTREIETTSPRLCLLNYLPDLVEAVGAAAFHTTIQLGYGIVSESPRAIAIGLAYFSYSYRDFGAIPEYDPHGAGGIENATSSLFDILDGIRKDSRLDGPVIPSKRKEGYQVCVRYLAEKYNDVILSHFVRWQPSLGTTPEESDKEIANTLKGLTRGLVELYDVTGNSYFFLLHGVTSIYSLRKIIEAISGPGIDPTKARELKISLIRYFVFMSLYLYIAEGRPDIHPQQQQLQHGTPEKVGAREEGCEWESVVEATINRVEDEHVIKLVQVCKEEYDNAMKEGDEDAARLFFRSAKATQQLNGNWQF